MFNGIIAVKRGLEVSPSMSTVNKFGWTPDCDTGSEQPIWDGGLSPKTYTYLTTASLLYLSSSNAGDKQVYQIKGLDENYNDQTENVTANGQTQVATTKKFIRVFRVKNQGSTNNAGDIYVASASGASSGVPSTAANIKAKITAGNNQTLMALYTVPAGYMGFMNKWYTSAGKAEDYYVTLRMRPFGGVFQIKDKQFVYEKYIERSFYPPKYITEKTDIVLMAQMITNSNKEVAGGFDIVLEKI